MKQFESLTKYIPLLEKCSIGYWHIDKESHGEHPVQMPFVIYAELIGKFTADVYTLVDRHPCWKLNCYSQILEGNGLSWGMAAMSGAIVEDLDALCVCALLVGSVRAERFCDGALKEFLENGSIIRWLKRLKDIDDAHSGLPKKLQILSDGFVYGPGPAPDKEAQQRLTLHRDGRVWFTGYFGGSEGRYVQSRRKQFHIPKEDAEALLDSFDAFFSCDPRMPLADDAGLWEAVLTHEAGIVCKYRGSMVGGYEVNDLNLSDLTRKLLPVDDLWVLGYPVHFSSLTQLI